eukprot:6015008-Prymnesium_polylepis.1
MWWRGTAPCRRPVTALCVRLRQNKHHSELDRIASIHAQPCAVPDGATRAAARLLLGELAAALGVEPTRQAHHGGGGAAV